MAPKNETQADADAIPVDMADEAVGSSSQDDEWEDVQVGLGRQWDFDKDGDLTALYLGTNEVPIKEENRRGDDDRDSATAHSFGLIDGSGEIVFVWGSYELDQAMTEIGTDDKVRIHSLGVENFSGNDGPRQVKRYRVQKAKK